MRVRTHLPAVPSIDRANTAVSAFPFWQPAPGSHRFRLLAMSAAALFVIAGTEWALAQTSSQTTLPEVTVEAKKAAKKRRRRKSSRRPKRPHKRKLARKPPPVR